MPGIRAVEPIDVGVVRWRRRARGRLVGEEAREQVRRPRLEALNERGGLSARVDNRVYVRVQSIRTSVHVRRVSGNRPA